MSKNDTKNQIIEHAARLFAEEGYHGLTTRAIATASGVNLGLIHYYFGSKQALWDAVLQEKEEELVYRINSGRQNSSEEDHDLWNVLLRWCFEEGEDLVTLWRQEPQQATAVLDRLCGELHGWDREYARKALLLAFSLSAAWHARPAGWRSGVGSWRDWLRTAPDWSVSGGPGAGPDVVDDRPERPLSKAIEPAEPADAFGIGFID